VTKIDKIDALRGQDTWMGEGSKEGTGCVVRQEGKGERSAPGVDRRGRRGQECTSKQEGRGKGVHGQTGGEGQDRMHK
jgi:hypothetical protein